MAGHLRFSLIPEEGIVKLLVIDVDFSELWSNSLSHFCLHRLFGFFLLKRLSHFHDSSLFDKLGELEWGLFDTTLSGEIFSLNQVG